MRAFTYLAGLTLFGLIPAPCPARGQEGRTPTARLMGIEEYRLENGLRVVLYPDPTKPTFTANLTVLVGSIYEGAGEAGMAHVFEHLLFHSLEGFPDVKETLKNLGASYNGTTSFDRTNYFETLSSSDENLDTAIRLEAARLGHATLKKEDLEKEGRIVEGEFDLGGFFPARNLFRGMFGAMYDFHAYSRDPIGTVEDFRSLKIENIRSFYKRYYSPDNAVFFLTGKFDKSKALDLIEKHFGGLKKGVESRPVYTTREPASQGERRYVIRRAGDSFHLLVGYRIPGAAAPDAAAAEVLSKLLASDRTGPLYDGLVGKGLATSVSVNSMDLRMASPFFAMAVVSKDKDPDAAEAAMVEILEKKTESATPADLDRAKSMVDREFDRVFNDPQELAGQLSSYEASGSWKLLLVRREQAKAMSLEALKAFAARYLRIENRVVGRFVPDAAAQPVTTEKEPGIDQYTGILSKIPTGTKAVREFSYSPESLQSSLRWLKVGPAKIALLQKEMKGDDVFIRISIPFAGRSVVRPQLTSGEALGSFMTERTASLSKEALAKRLAEWKSEVHVNVSLEGATVTIQTKRNVMPSMLELAVEMLRTPMLEDQALKEYVNRQEGLLKAQHDNPQVLIQVELMRMIFPEGDPRRPDSIDEKREHLKSLDLGALKSFHREFFGAEGMVASVVGDVRPEDLTATMTPLLSPEWKAEKPFKHEANSGVDEVTAPLVRVATPGKPSAFNILAQPVRLSATSPDCIPLHAVAWALFEDPLGSRIPKRVREVEALSYAIMGQYASDPNGDFGLLFIFTVTKPENAGKSIDLVKSELGNALTSGLTAEELESFKKAYKSRMTTMRSNDLVIAATILELENAGLDFSWWARQDEQAGALTLDEMNAALRKYVRPQKAGLLQIGDFK